MADDPARWQRLESIVAAALSRVAEDRPAFLADACGGDDDLRREAASLLERASRADGFLANPLDAEREGLTRIFTLDRRHFSSYRPGRRRRSAIVPPLQRF